MFTGLWKNNRQVQGWEEAGSGGMKRSSVPRWRCCHCLLTTGEVGVSFCRLSLPTNIMGALYFSLAPRLLKGAVLKLLFEASRVS